MGCGEYNPLSLSASDAESRRAVVFVFDPAAGPVTPPCQLRSTGPCLANCDPAPTSDDPSGAPPYRCKVYRDAAARCPCQGGLDLSHDLLVRVPVDLSDAGSMGHVFLLESDDGTLSLTQSLASDSRALDDESVELQFRHLPEIHAYRLSYQVDGVTNVLFDFTPYDQIPDLVVPGLPDDDTGAIAQLFGQTSSDDDQFAGAVVAVRDPNDPDRTDSEGSS
jgi:hypothetical protein